MGKYFEYIIIVFNEIFNRLLQKNEEISYCLFFIVYGLCQAFIIKNKHFQI